MDKMDLKKLMMELGSMEIDSVLVEGGGAIHGSFLTSGLVQKVYCYIAPEDDWRQRCIIAGFGKRN